MRIRRTLPVVAAVLAALVGGLVAGGGRAQATLPAWPQEAAGATIGLACPAPATCLAVAGTDILRTTDGARTWHATGLKNPRIFLRRLSCPGAGVCYAIGIQPGSGAIKIVGFRTGNGGASWLRLKGLPASGPDIFSVDSLSCPTTSICYATGQTTLGRSYLLATRDAGATWTQARVGRGDTDVACPAAQICYLEYNYLWKTTSAKQAALQPRGRAWRMLPVGGGLPELPFRGYVRSLACPSVRTCFVLAYAPTPVISQSNPLENSTIWRTRNGGATWARVFHKNHHLVGSLTCSDALTCFAPVSYRQVLGTHDGGATWSTSDGIWKTAPLPDNEAAALSDTRVACDPDHVCYLVSSVGPAVPHGSGWTNEPTAFVSKDGGLTWTSV